MLFILFPELMDCTSAFSFIHASKGNVKPILGRFKIAAGIVCLKLSVSKGFSFRPWYFI